MASNEFNFFQLYTGIDGGMGKDNQHRPFDKKMSRYGDLDKGTRFAFSFKDERSNPMLRDVDKHIIANPFVEGSSIKYVRDDKFVRMSMGSINPVARDVSDRVKADANSEFYMPAEGWRSFGGKIDFHRQYQGGRLQG